MKNEEFLIKTFISHLPPIYSSSYSFMSKDKKKVLPVRENRKFHEEHIK